MEGAGPSTQSRRFGRRMRAGTVNLRLNLNCVQQNDAAHAQGGENIEKRFHGIIPLIDAYQTSLFLFTCYREMVLKQLSFN